jgi:hypothetical protein
MQLVPLRGGAGENRLKRETAFLCPIGGGLHELNPVETRRA